jgi:hypothetical protein
MAPERDGKGRFVPQNHGGSGDDGGEQPPSPLSRAIADAIAKFEDAKLQGDQLRVLANQMHRLHPEAKDWRPEEERLAQDFFQKKIDAACGTLRRFETLIAPGREGEAIGVLTEFVNTAFNALVLIVWKEFDKALVNLVYTGNHLSHPPPLKPLDEYWMKLAYNLGYNGDEREAIKTELLRDNSPSLRAIDQFGFVTSNGRQVNRLKMREEHAPREEPWRSKFFESLPRIQGR